MMYLIKLVHRQNTSLKILWTTVFIILSSISFQSFGAPEKSKQRPSEKEIQELLELYLKKNSEGIVSPTDRPAIYQTLNSILEPISKAQKMEAADRENWTYKIHLVRGHAVDAFVVPYISDDYKKVDANIYIYTGLIEKLSRESNFPHLIEMLAGVVSHEVAHLIDKTDSKFSIENHYKMGKQAIEIRTDLVGQSYLTKAGYSPSGLGEALRAIHSDSHRQSKSNILEPGYRTHPTSHLRTATLDMAQTYRRSKEGTTEIVLPHQSILELESDFLKELEMETPNRYIFIPPKSLKEAVDRLKQLFWQPEEVVKNQGEIIELSKFHLNCLILWIDQWLLTQQESKLVLSSANRSHFYRYIKLLRSKVNNSVNYPSSRVEWHELILTPETIAAYQLRSELPNAIAWGRSHFFYLEKVKLFSSIRTKKFWLRTDDRIRNPTFDLGYGNYYWEDISKDFRFVMPGYSILSHFKENFQKLLLKEGLVEHGLDYNRGIDTRLMAHGNIMQPDFFSSYLILSFKEYFKNLPNEKKLLWMMMPKMGAYFPLPKYSNEGETRNMSHVWNYTKDDMLTKRKLRTYWLHAKIRAKHGDKVSQQFIDELTEYMKYFWDLRGPLAMTELVSNNSSVDWAWFFEFFDIRPDVGYQAIREDVKQFLLKKKTYEAFDKQIDPLDIAILALKYNLTGFNPQLPWMNNSTSELILSFSDIDTQLVKKAFSNPIYNSNPKLFFTKIERQLRLDLEMEIWSKDKEEVWKQFLSVEKNIFSDLTGSETKPLHAKHREEYTRISIDTILESNIPDSSKSTLLEHLIDPFAKYTYRHNFGLTKRYFVELKKYALIKNSLSFVKQTIESNQQDSNKDSYLFRMRVIKAISSEFSKELRSYSNKSIANKLAVELALNITELFNYKYELSAHSNVTESFEQKVWKFNILTSEGNKDIRTLKQDLVLVLSDPKIETEIKLQAFYNLTTNKSSKATDDFFKTEILPNLNPKDNETRLQILQNSQIQDQAVKAILYRSILENRISNSEIGKNKVAFLETMNQELQSFFPGSSFDKDKMLEEIAWRLNIQGENLVTYIEQNKSYNWKRINPYIINFGSLGVEIITSLNYDLRLHLMEHVLSPEKVVFPKSIESEIEDKLNEWEQSSSKYDDKSPEEKEQIKEKSKLQAHDFSEAFSAFIVDSRPSERIPLLVLLLSEGPEAIVFRANYLQILDRRFFKAGEHSVQHKVLESFLEIIPRAELATSLAFLLSQQDGTSESYLKVFEAFNSVGKKFAQFASIWHLFGKEKSEILKGAKSKAEPMTKYEIETILREGLSGKEFNSIDYYISILGAASMKNAVLVKLRNGEELVFVVQDKRIEQQIRSDLNLIKMGTQRLKAKGVSSQSSMFELVIETMETQLLEEKSLIQEARKISIAKQLFSEIQLDMKMDGWIFHVPSQSSHFTPKENILALEQAKGFEFDKLSKEQQNKIGPYLVKANLVMLFKYGWFDADRHQGNWLMDEANKIIYPIDFGELESFVGKQNSNPDSRILIFDFISAVVRKDAIGVYNTAKQMSSNLETQDEKKTLLDLKRLYSSTNKWTSMFPQIDALIKLFAGKSNENELSDRLVNTLEVLAQNSIVLEKKYSFSAIKGLMILMGEKYVSTQQFSKIFLSEALKVKVFKPKLRAISCSSSFDP